MIDDLRTFTDDSFATAKYVRSADDAIKMLDLTVPDIGWDEIWWDYDLGDGKDALAVLNWLRDKPISWFVDTRHYVHTSNPVGAERLTKELTLRYGHTRVRRVSVFQIPHRVPATIFYDGEGGDKHFRIEEGLAPKDQPRND